MERLFKQGKQMVKEIHESANTVHVGSFSEFGRFSRQYQATEVLVKTEHIKGQFVATFGTQGQCTSDRIITTVTTTNATRQVKYEIEHRYSDTEERTLRLVATALNNRNMTMLTLPSIPISISVTDVGNDQIDELLEQVSERNIRPYQAIQNKNFVEGGDNT